MARSEVTAQSISRSGITPSFAAADANGHKFRNDGKVFLEVKNASASPITVTIQTPGTIDGLAITDRTVTVAATTGDVMIGPFPPGAYNQKSGSDRDMVYVDYSAVTSVTVALFRLAS